MGRLQGASVLEMMLVIAVVGVLALIAVPRLAEMRARVSVAMARDAFAATHALARQVSGQYGGLSRLHLDPDENRFWVTVDTSSVPGVVALDTVRPVVDVAERFAGVTIDAAARVFCFDPRGLATARGDCNLANATLVFRNGDVADTVTTSRLGRLRRR